MMPELKLPGGFRLEPRQDGTYALFGAGSDWQVGCIGVEAVKEFAAAMTRPDGGDSLREALEQCQKVLASLIDVEAIKATTVMNAYEQVFAAECQARTALAAKDGE